MYVYMKICICKRLAFYRCESRLSRRFSPNFNLLTLKYLLPEFLRFFHAVFGVLKVLNLHYCPQDCLVVIVALLLVLLENVELNNTCALGEVNPRESPVAMQK